MDRQKFNHCEVTAEGQARAHVAFHKLQTLWLHTGSLCNITCANCYMASSPKADHFVYLSTEDTLPFLDEVTSLGYGPIEIGLTGGEPFMNPKIIPICEAVLARGHRLLILTNAMAPMMRARVRAGLIDLQNRYAGQIILRVSLDHFTAEEHDKERGTGSFAASIKGMGWLSKEGFSLHIAGRSMFSESDAAARAGYSKLIKREGWDIDANDPGAVVLFPEMDGKMDVPEITTACWDILGISPDSMMCASSRMVVRRKGAAGPSILPCTLLWEDTKFDMGPNLAGSLEPVSLNHPHCAKFCVLGGASCSA